MNSIPARLLLPQARNCPSRPPMRERDRQRRAYILEAARNIFTAHGRSNIKLADIAGVVHMAPVTVRQHVADIHHLFGLILTQHLDAVLAAILQVQGTQASLPARRREEYLRVTRNFGPEQTRIHVLWLRERFALPPDELEPLERQRQIIGTLVGGEAWRETLALLDCTAFDREMIEILLEARAAAHIAARAEAHAAAQAVQAAAPEPEPAQSAPAAALTQTTATPHPTPIAAQPEPPPEPAAPQPVATQTVATEPVASLAAPNAAPAPLIHRPIGLTRASRLAAPGALVWPGVTPGPRQDRALFAHAPLPQPAHHAPQPEHPNPNTLT